MVYYLLYLPNIVLNELDWWISSQWENMPTHTQYKPHISKNGTVTYANKFRVLRESRLKEMYIVRYADDFKIFCGKRSNADKIFTAVKNLLKERLKLNISQEKSKKRVAEKLKQKIVEIEHSRNAKELGIQVRHYNTIVFGIHNYYRIATHISCDC